ncbi:hypothetical protein QBC46DRAFT_390200, partial [Diplogelasinospora grovesii]
MPFPSTTFLASFLLDSHVLWFFVSKISPAPLHASKLRQDKRALKGKPMIHDLDFCVQLYEYVLAYLVVILLSCRVLNRGDAA